MWNCTYGTVTELTTDDLRYDFSEPDAVVQLAWEPPK